MCLCKDKHTSKRSGFTLVELLVVISIIALLLAILMPALGRAREQAQEILCRSHLNQMSLAFMLYAEDHDRYPRVYGPVWTDHWWHAIRPYFAEKKVSEGQDFEEHSDTFICPSRKTGKEFGHDAEIIRTICSYGMYINMSCAKPVQVIRPSECVAITDISSPWAGGPFGSWGFFSISRPSGTGATDWDTYSAAFWAPPPGNGNAAKGYCPTERHREGTIIVWGDGHVSWMNTGELFAEGTDKYFTFAWEWSSCPDSKMRNLT